MLPFSLDLAYFYIQQVSGESKTQAWRVPEGSRTFLPESGVKLNLYNYLDSVADLRMAPDLELEMDLWGWSGGTLIHAGAYHLSLHRSILLICSVEGAGGCTGGGGGQWLPEITLSTSKAVSEQAYEIMWQASSLSPVKDVCLQLAQNPYIKDDWWQGISLPINSFCMDVKKGGIPAFICTSLEKFSIPRARKTPASGEWGWTKLWISPATGFSTMSVLASLLPSSCGFIRGTKRLDSTVMPISG